MGRKLALGFGCVIALGSACGSCPPRPPPQLPGAECKLGAFASLVGPMVAPAPGHCHEDGRWLLALTQNKSQCQELANDRTLVSEKATLRGVDPAGGCLFHARQDSWPAVAAALRALLPRPGQVVDEPDCRIVLPSAAPDELLDSVAGLLARPPLASGDPVKIAVVDDAAGPDPGSHAEAVGYVAERAACAGAPASPPGAPPCPVQISYSQAIMDPCGGSCAPGYSASASPRLATWFELGQAITSAVEGGGERLVINLSLGWFADTDHEVQGLGPRYVRQVLEWARCRGAVVIAAAGNSQAGTQRSARFLPAGWQIEEPAELPLVYAVAGLHASGVPLATYQGGLPPLAALGQVHHGAWWVGSSMSTALVSGLVARAWSEGKLPSGHRAVADLYEQSCPAKGPARVELPVANRSGWTQVRHLGMAAPGRCQEEVRLAETGRVDAAAPDLPEVRPIDPASETQPYVHEQPDTIRCSVCMCRLSSGQFEAQINWGTLPPYDGEARLTLVRPSGSQTYNLTTPELQSGKRVSYPGRPCDGAVSGYVDTWRPSKGEKAQTAVRNSITFAD